MSGVLGLDLSLTSTGWARTLDGGEVELGRLRPPAAMRDGMRLAWIRRALTTVIVTPGDPPVCPYTLIVIEALPSGSHTKFDMSGIAMVHAVTRLILWDAGVDATWMPQAKVKVFATGKGNASKDEVLLAASRRLGYEGSSNDEADALWMMHMGLCHVGEPCESLALPLAHTRALDGVEWVMAR